MKNIIYWIWIMISGLALFCSPLLAKGNKDQERIIYKYKEYEKFDFEDLVIEGDSTSPGDLSVLTRYQRKFDNKLPYRRSFNKEIKKSVGSIR